MNYSIYINSNYTAKVKLCSGLYYSTVFTLTVNAVNDTPIDFHPLNGIICLGDESMVLNYVIFNFFQNNSNCICRSCILPLFSIVV